MKKLLTLCLMVFTASALADYIFVVPQKPGSGTSQWAQIVATQLEPFLGENITIKHIPGARDIPGFNEFHNSLRTSDKIVMVSHGGNGVSFLQEKVDYDYRDYDSIGLMNLNIIAAKRIGENMDYPKFSAGSGKVPEAWAMALLICGNKSTSMDYYIACFNEHVTWVNGMSNSERRLAFKRGELNGTRENPAAYKKHVETDENAEIWFHHGILQADGSHADDPNHPGFQLEILFEERWDAPPSGEFYDAYKLVKSFRDGMQKALWVNKGNPNTFLLRNALHQMSLDPDAVAAIQKKVGNYEWMIGEEGNAQVDTLMELITEDTLKNLIRFNIEALGLASIYKENLIMEVEVPTTSIDVRG